jgi:CelD/BcsL family acetyltransferase involved in cellulose biosynthesis
MAPVPADWDENSVSRICLDICPPDPGLIDAFEDLVRRASGNVFMNPCALDAAARTKFARIHVLLAWEQGSAPRRLVGLWALQERSLVLVAGFLAAPPYDYAFVSNPVVDPAFVGEVIPAFFAAIANHKRLPNVVRLKYLDGESETCAAILASLAVCGSERLTLSEHARPHVTREFGLKRSGSTRKKLRQDWNRLSAMGTVDVVNETAADSVRAAFETFLALEAASWKGEHGTALLSDEEDAAFARRFIATLAARHDASVALLRVDGRPIAAQVVLYCGRMAYTWKTAFDSAYAKYSPGVLLIDKITEQLFAGERIEAIESCSPEGSFMAGLWEGRRTTLDLLVDVGPEKSFNFTVAALAERGFAQLRALRNRVQSAARLSKPAPRGAHA